MQFHMFSWSMEGCHGVLDPCFAEIGIETVSPPPMSNPQQRSNHGQNVVEMWWFCMVLHGPEMVLIEVWDWCWQRTASKLGSSNTCPIPARGQIMVKIWSFHMVLHGFETVLRWVWNRVLAENGIETRSPPPMSYPPPKVKTWSKCDDFSCFYMVLHGFEMGLRCGVVRYGPQNTVKWPFHTLKWPSDSLKWPPQVTILSCFDLEAGKMTSQRWSMAARQTLQMSS